MSEGNLKRGRPRLPESEVRRCQAVVYLNQEEREAVETAAFEAGLSVSEWGRKAMGDALEEPDDEPTN